MMWLGNLQYKYELKFAFTPDHFRVATMESDPRYTGGQPTAGVPFPSGQPTAGEDEPDWGSDVPEESDTKAGGQPTAGPPTFDWGLAIVRPDPKDLRMRSAFWDGGMTGRICIGQSTIDPLTQLRWLGGWHDAPSSVIVGGSYAFWTARLKDFRVQYQNFMEPTEHGFYYPPEFSCVIYTLMTHVYDLQGQFVGWQERDMADLAAMLEEMRYFVAL